MKNIIEFIHLVKKVRKEPKYFFVYIFALMFLGIVSFFLSFMTMNFIDNQLNIVEKIPYFKRAPSSLDPIQDVSVRLECGRNLCSGSIIGKNTILTAKHCIIDKQGRSRIKTCKVIHRNKTYGVYHKYRIVSDREEWTLMHVTANFPRDIKPLKLAKDLSPYVKENFKKEILCSKSSSFYMFDEIYDKRTKRCEIHDILEMNSETNRFYHNCKIDYGNSGSGLIKKFNNEFYLIGMNTQKLINSSEQKFFSILEAEGF